MIVVAACLAIVLLYDALGDIRSMARANAGGSKFHIPVAIAGKCTTLALNVVFRFHSVLNDTRC